MQGILKDTEQIIVLGNQAADLDSAVSALVLASFFTLLQPGVSAQGLIQGSLEDLRLKPEIKSLFDRAGRPLRASDFITEMDEIKTKDLFLVDHNSRPGFKVSGIIDHHEDEGDHRDAGIRIIEKTGSSASLVSRLFHEYNLSIPHTEAFLLAGAIALDTGYLNEEWGKTTDLDRKEYALLSRHMSPSEIDFLHSLLDIKNDLSHLTLEDQLKRDFKGLELKGLKGGIASLPLSIEEVFREGFYSLDVIESFMEERSPDFLFLTHSTIKPFSRQISLYLPADAAASGIQRALESLNIGLSPMIRKRGIWLCYDQADKTVSRKVLVPLLKEACR